MDLMDPLQPLRQQHLLVLMKGMYMRMLGACPQWVRVLQTAPVIQHLANAITELQLVISGTAKYTRLHVALALAECQYWTIMKRFRSQPDQPLQDSLIFLQFEINAASLMTYDTADRQQPAVS